MSTDHAALLVVGGGPAALSSATAYRDHGGTGPVMVVSDDDRHPYFRPALSKEYLRGEISEEQLALAEPDTLSDNDIQFRLNCPVASIDTTRSSAVLTDGCRLRYDTCILATGAAPKYLPVPGARDQRIAYLRSARSRRSLRAAAETADTALVVGSGFIGCEAAVSLAHRGIDVVVVSAEALPQRERLGIDAGWRLQRWLDEAGVRFIGHASVEAIENGQTVRLHGHEPLAADLVLIAAGIEPRSVPVEGTPVATHQGRLVVDEHMRSSAEALLAAGDAAYAHNAAAGRPLAVEHWGEATAMGAIAGATAAGARDRWEHPPGFWSAIGEKTLKYAAWGDGHDDTWLIEHDDAAFTIWYLRDNTVVGVLTHDSDQDYERGRELVRTHAPATAI